MTLDDWRDMLDVVCSASYRMGWWSNEGEFDSWDAEYRRRNKALNDLIASIKALRQERDELLAENESSEVLSQWFTLLRSRLETIEDYAQHRTASHHDAVQLLLDIRALAGKTLAETNPLLKHEEADNA